MTKKILLILIILLAFALRFWNLGSYPALNADEASNGYDAYSLIQTGMDQHEHPWPLTFQSFNDYKPGLYGYLDIPFVKVLGLNEWSVRIPGALLGVLSVLMIYLLVKELFPRQEFQISNFKFQIEEIAALFLAISPWHIQFSRGGWEVNVSTMFVLIGVYLFILFLRTRNIWHLIFGICNLALSMYTYHSPRVIVPLLGLAAVLIYRNEIFVRQNYKKIFVGIIFAILIMIPLIRDLTSPGALSRLSGLGLLADTGPLNRINEQRGEYTNPSNKLGILLHNKVVNYGLDFAKNWSSHFSGEFLFMTGDAVQRNKVPDMGEMYLFDMLFLCVGFIAIARTYSLYAKPYTLVLCWLLIAPIPSSLTFQAPSALRAEIMVIPLIIISAIGCNQIIEWLISRKNKLLGGVGILILIMLVVWNFARYEHMYWVHMSKEYPYSSQYGVNELVNYISENQSKYNDIFVTNRYDQPYILFLFYMKYPPQNFQFHHVLTTRDGFGFSTVANFDKYHFGHIDFNSMQKNHHDSLIIGTPQEIPQSANIIKRIYGTNGFEYFDVVSN